MKALSIIVFCLVWLGAANANEQRVVMESEVIAMNERVLDSLNDRQEEEIASDNCVASGAHCPDSDAACCAGGVSCGGDLRCE